MKRTFATTTDEDNKRNKPSMICEYTGYSFQTDKVDVAIVDANSIDLPEFFTRFISQRRPCILQTPSNPKNELVTVTPQNLIEVAGDEVVQVEKRFSESESFGQNRTKSRQIEMKIKDLLEQLRGSEGELYYLSTQQYHIGDADENDNNNEKPPAAFQTPCAQLLQSKYIVPTLPWASTLRLESCNLWMGSSRNGSPSGLHHDFHDNFYVLLQGKKQFRLYSPDTALSMKTHGTIERIHFNGVISYVGSEIKADGTPTRVWSTERDRVSDDEHEDEEEFVVGKGFDYQSDEDDNDDEEENLIDMDGPDDFDELVQDDLEVRDSNDDNGEEEQRRPNSFSRIDLSDGETNDDSKFLACNECVVELNVGQILYLPAGWFHHVTSYGSKVEANQDDRGPSRKNKDDSHIHLAVNYWYHPPDKLDSFGCPYSDA